MCGKELPFWFHEASSGHEEVKRCPHNATAVLCSTSSSNTFNHEIGPRERRECLNVFNWELRSHGTEILVCVEFDIGIENHVEFLVEYIAWLEKMPWECEAWGLRDLRSR